MDLLTFSSTIQHVAVCDVDQEATLLGIRHHRPLELNANMLLPVKADFGVALSDPASEISTDLYLVNSIEVLAAYIKLSISKQSNT